MDTAGSRGTDFRNAPIKTPHQSAPPANAQTDLATIRLRAKPAPVESEQLRTRSKIHSTIRRNIRIAQINLARSQLASNELATIAARENTDILIIQEPYAIRNTPTKPTASAKLVTANGPDEYPWATIIVLNPAWRITNIKQAGNEYLAVAHVETEQEEIYIASIYMRNTEDPADLIDKIENLIRRTKGKNIIIGGDTNSQSTSWGADHTNTRGEHVEDLITRQGLEIINKENQPPTFQTLRAKSFIDLTLAKGRVTRRISNWVVREGETTSDHNLITYEISPDTRDGRGTRNENHSRFNTRIRNLKKLHEALQEYTRHLDSLPTHSPQEVEELSEELEKAVVRACRETLSTRKAPRTQVKWWTARLTSLKRKTHQARRYAQHEEDGQEKDAATTRYRYIFQKYRAEVRTAKRN